MAAKHASLCRAKLTGRNADCECDASDTTRTKLFTPGGMVNRIDQPATESEPPRRSPVRRVLRGDDGVPLGEDPPAAEPECRCCSECVGQEHHWLENPDFEDEDDPEFACKHCDATCRAIDDGDGLPLPSGIVVTPQTDTEDGRVSVPRAPMSLTEEQRRVLLASWSEIVGGGIPRPDPEVSDKTYLDHIGSLVSDRSSLVSVERVNDFAIDLIKDRPIRILQICPACREAHAVTASDQPTEMETYAVVGAAARRARLMHKCPDITTQLSVLSFDDMQKLAEDLERAYITIGTRHEEVIAYAAARRARESES